MSKLTIKVFGWNEKFKKFMDYAFSMPSKIKNVGETKSLVRQAYNDILPEEIIASSKRGWDIPKDEWVSQDADYKIFNSRFKQHPNIESWFNVNNLQGVEF